MRFYLRTTNPTTWKHFQALESKSQMKKMNLTWHCKLVYDQKSWGKWKILWIRHESCSFQPFTCVSVIGPRISEHLNAPKISAAFIQCQSHRYLYPQVVGDHKAPLIVLFPHISATPVIDSQFFGQIQRHATTFQVPRVPVVFPLWCSLSTLLRWIWNF